MTPRIVAPQDGERYRALAHLNRAIDRALRPFRGDPAVEAHYALVATLNAEAEARLREADTTQAAD